MRLHRASLWAGAISGGMSQWEDTKAYRSGHLTGNQYAAHTTKNVTGAVGIMAGIEYGAIMGTSLLPGIGTIVGSIVGGLLGDRLGRTVGMQAGNILFNNRAMMNQPLFANNQSMPLSEIAMPAHERQTTEGIMQ
ncbi:hypothetical protein [Ammoniphilus sp. 3BR4]|uniref:hypothetical protein n=1 Tax=Ammoniphilus sp. 3BR4 TaxID=3158265 RepID=UPI003466CCE0